MKTHCQGSSSFTFLKEHHNLNKKQSGHLWARANTMRTPSNCKKKRSYKCEDSTNGRDVLINSNPGLRSPKASPRRTPKKRKNRNSNKTQKHENQQPPNSDRNHILTLENRKETCINETSSNLQNESENPKLVEEKQTLETVTAEKSLYHENHGKIEKSTEEEQTEHLEEKCILPKAEPDTDEGYNSSFIEPENQVLDASFSTDIKTCAVRSSFCNSEISNLNAEFITKLKISNISSVSQGVQTEPDPKRRKISKACQITDEAVVTLNKKLLNMRDKMNKKIIENERCVNENETLKRKCSNLNTERLSLLAQTEALQTECVKNINDNDKLKLKLDKRECHIQALKESLVMRDKEITVFHKSYESGIPQQLTDYRELELLRIDNIRLLHDNRALTSSLDSLNGQLCALRRISKQYDDCSDNVIMMNKRLAEDNNFLAGNLSSVKRELRNVNQEHEQTQEELRSIRGSYKRTLTERDDLKNQVSSPRDLVKHDNEVLVSQNVSLKQAAALLSEKVQALHEELSTTRTDLDLALQDLDLASEEKVLLQNEVVKLEENNSTLWRRVGELRKQYSEQTDLNKKQYNENNILSSENEELRKANDNMQDKAEKIRSQLNQEISKNSTLAAQIVDLNKSLSRSTLSIKELKNTMEFLQMEHTFIETDVEKKDFVISELKEKLDISQHTKEDLVYKCKQKLKEKNKKLNASRIKLGYALMELRNLNSQGSESSFSSC